MTLEQQRALAIASARLRMSQGDFAAIKADGPNANAMPISPAAQSSMSSQISPYLPTERGTDVAGEIAQAPYELGAKVNDAAAKVLPAPVAAGLGTAANVGMEGAGMLAGGAIGAGAGMAARPAMQGTGRALMKSAIKPTWGDQRSGKAARAIETMLEDGYSPTIGGVDKIKTRVAALKGEADNLIAGSTGTVDKYAVADRLRPLYRDVEKSPLPNSGINTVTNAETEFLSHPSLLGTSSMPVQLAQEMKSRAYKEMGDSAYGMGLKPAAERDALKALARGFKEEIEGVVPQVAPINAKTTELLNAQKVAERRALMQGNNNPASLGVSLATMTNNPMLALSMWANSSSAAKAALARMLYTGGKAAPAAGAVTGAGMAALLRDEQ